SVFVMRIEIQHDKLQDGEYSANPSWLLHGDDGALDDGALDDGALMDSLVGVTLDNDYLAIGDHTRYANVGYFAVQSADAAAINEALMHRMMADECMTSYAFMTKAGFERWRELHVNYRRKHTGAMTRSKPLRNWQRTFNGRRNHAG